MISYVCPLLSTPIIHPGSTVKIGWFFSLFAINEYVADAQTQQPIVNRLWVLSDGDCWWYWQETTFARVYHDNISYVVGYLAGPVSGGKLGYILAHSTHDNAKTIKQQSTINGEWILSLWVGVGTVIHPSNFTFWQDLMAENSPGKQEQLQYTWLVIVR